MGKSTAANMLESLGVAVHDSDACVHDLFVRNHHVQKELMQIFPYILHLRLYGKKDANGNRIINRKRLGEYVFKRPKERKKLENILHPRVRDSQNAFIRQHRNAGADIIALDIPLLFETHADTRVDYVITVAAPRFIQNARVLGRPGMHEKKYNAIRAAQMSDEEKIMRSDFVLPTGLGRAYTMKALKQIIHDLRAHNTHHKILKKG